MHHATHVMAGGMEHAGHHLVHVVLVSIAAVVFGLYVAMDIRRNGFSGFSWKLAATAPTRTGDVAPR